MTFSLLELFKLITFAAAGNFCCSNFPSLWFLACETMPGNVGCGPGLLSAQQELFQWPAGTGTPVFQGQDDGGEMYSFKQSSAVMYVNVEM